MSDSVSREGATASATQALKPDFKVVDKASVEALLRAQPGSEDAEVFELEGGSESSGSSSGIVMFSARINGEEKGYVLRFAPYNSEGRIFKDYNIEAQHYLHKLLSEAGVPVPASICFDVEGNYLPLPGFVMERIEAEVPNQPAFSSGLFSDAARIPTLLDEVLKGLAKVHAVDWKGLGLDKYTRSGGGDSYLEQYINWYWETARWAELPTLERMKPVRQWLMDNQPAMSEDEMTLVHGDTNLGNYMFKDDKLAAIIDWEMPAIAHPSLDIALLCNYFDHCRRASPPEIQAITPHAEEWKARYEEMSGNPLDHFDYFKALVSFTGTVILTSMGRSMPEEHQAGWAMMIEPLWQIVAEITGVGE